MPNRILKESICTSDNLNDLSEEAENFFYRLLVCCDDFGRFDGRPAIIKARCYPLKETKSTEMIVSYLEMLQTSKIITIYHVDGKPYIQMQTWDKHQQVRAKKSKFPAPVVNLISDDIKCNPLIENVPVIQSESNPIQSESEEIPYEQIRMAYNKFCRSFPSAASMTRDRVILVKTLWLKYQTHEGGPLRFFDKLFKQVEASSFLKESTSKGKKWCNFDWILDPDHAVKIIEGLYDNGDPRTSESLTADKFDSIMKGVIC